MCLWFICSHCCKIFHVAGGHVEYFCSVDFMRRVALSVACASPDAHVQSLSAGGIAELLGTW